MEVSTASKVMQMTNYEHILSRDCPHDPQKPSINAARSSSLVLPEASLGGRYLGSTCTCDTSYSNQMFISIRVTVLHASLLSGRRAEFSGSPMF